MAAMGFGQEMPAEACRVLEIGQNQINNNTGNGVLVGTGGVVETFVNNSIRGNAVDACPGCTSVGPGN